jgi:F-type H+-transporting ATPase subunit delta
VRRGAGVARRYARALFGLEDSPAGRAALLEQVERLSGEILGHDALAAALFRPIHPRAERRALTRQLAERLELSEVVRAFGELLVEESRAKLLPQIAEELRELVERAEGRVQADVVSARPLAPGQVEELREALGRRVNAQVDVKLEVDPGLIGGIVARVGDLLLDGSVRTQLASLGGSLRRGSR